MIIKYQLLSVIKTYENICYIWERKISWKKFALALSAKNQCKLWRFFLDSLRYHFAIIVLQSASNS